jgi:hypothetical protein
MTNYDDTYGNMAEITSSQDRIGRYNQKVISRNSKGKSLARKVVGIGLILGAITAGGIGLERALENLIKADYANSTKILGSQNESVIERRAKMLEQARKELSGAQDSAAINGLNLVIKDIENGVYDYSK